MGSRVVIMQTSELLNLSIGKISFVLQSCQKLYKYAIMQTTADLAEKRRETFFTATQIRLEFE